MKYKWRYRWARLSCEDEEESRNWEQANSVVYWDTLWVASDEYDSYQPWVVLRKPTAKGYFVSPGRPNTPETADIGPYRTLAEAKIAAETMSGLTAEE